MSETSSRSSVKKADTEERSASKDYVLPVVGVHVPSVVVDVAFWGGLAGAVAVGAIEPPLGVLVGAGVIVARHQAQTQLQDEAG